MTLTAPRAVALSLSLLLAGTSLAQAGFIWIAPENQAAQAAPPPEVTTSPAPMASPVAETAPPMDMAPAAPVALSPAPVAEMPMERPVAMAPEPAMAPPQAPVEEPASATLSNETMQSAPIDNGRTVVVSQTPPMNAAVAAPVDASLPAISQRGLSKDSSAVSLQPIDAPAMSQPTRETQPRLAEVQVSAGRNMDAMDLAPTPSAPAAPAIGGGMTASTSMPAAESLINEMPSMTAPKPAPMDQSDASSAMSDDESATVQSAPAEAPRRAVSVVTGNSMGGSSGQPAAPVSAGQVDGFGKQVPLVIALRQILPSDYGFAHSDGVDLTQTVDWQGGKPWPEVLRETIAQAGLTATITGDTVLLEKSDGRSVVAEAAAAPAQPMEMAAPASSPPTEMASAPAFETARPMSDMSSPEQEMAPELTPPVEISSAAGSSNGGAVLVNSTMMQTPPAN